MEAPPRSHIIEHHSLLLAGLFVTARARIPPAAATIVVCVKFATASTAAATVATATTATAAAATAGAAAAAVVLTGAYSYYPWTCRATPRVCGWPGAGSVVDAAAARPAIFPAKIGLDSRSCFNARGGGYWASGVAFYPQNVACLSGKSNHGTITRNENK